MSREGGSWTRRETLVTLGLGVCTLPLAEGCAFLRGGAQHMKYLPGPGHIDKEVLRIPLRETPTLTQGRVLHVKPGKSYKDLLILPQAGGPYRVVAANCTHWGCVVDWNAAKNEWQCPCHGSRYAPDGRVLEGPAKKALAAPSARLEGESLVIDLAVLKEE